MVSSCHIRIRVSSPSLCDCKKMCWVEIFQHMGLFGYCLLQNWKHCSKIIFKCVNGAVGLSFKEKVAELCICRSREQCTGLTEKNASIGKRASQRRHGIMKPTCILFTFWENCRKKIEQEPTYSSGYPPIFILYQSLVWDLMATPTWQLHIFNDP